MNHIYCLIWNASLNCFVIVSEIRKSKKKCSIQKNRKGRSLRYMAGVMAFSLLAGAGAVDGENGQDKFFDQVPSGSEINGNNGSNGNNGNSGTGVNGSNGTNGSNGGMGGKLGVGGDVEPDALLTGGSGGAGGTGGTGGVSVGSIGGFGGVGGKGGTGGKLEVSGDVKLDATLTGGRGGRGGRGGVGGFGGVGSAGGEGSIGGEGGAGGNIEVDGDIEPDALLTGGMGGMGGTGGTGGSGSIGGKGSIGGEGGTGGNIKADGNIKPDALLIGGSGGAGGTGGAGGVGRGDNGGVGGNGGNGGNGGEGSAGGSIEVGGDIESGAQLTGGMGGIGGIGGVGGVGTGGFGSIGGKGSIGGEGGAGGNIKVDGNIKPDALLIGGSGGAGGTGGAGGVGRADNGGIGGNGGHGGEGGAGGNIEVDGDIESGAQLTGGMGGMGGMGGRGGTGTGGIGGAGNIGGIDGNDGEGGAGGNIYILEHAYNQGILQGGQAGQGYTSGQPGKVILLSTSNLTNQGIIKAGLKADGTASDVALELSGGNTLVLSTGSTIEGNIVSKTVSGNQLILQGTGTEDNNFIGDASVAGSGFSALSMQGNDWILSGQVNLTGTQNDTLKVVSGKLIIEGLVNQLTGGGNTIAPGTTLQIGNGGTSGAVAGTIVNDGVLLFKRANKVTYSNKLSGAGLIQLDSADLTLSADATGFTGQWESLANSLTTITEAKNLGSGKINLAGQLNVTPTTSRNYTFNNMLVGDGTLKVNLPNSSNQFSLGEIGTKFTGTVHLGAGQFSLSSAHVEKLSQATLELDADQVTTLVFDGERELAGLSLTGGKLVFAAQLPPDEVAAGTLKVGQLNLQGGSLAVTLGDPLMPQVNPEKGLLQQDMYTKVKVISTDKVEGDIAHINLVSSSNDEPINTNKQLLDLKQGESQELMGKAEYGYCLKIKPEVSQNNKPTVYIGYALRQIHLDQDNKKLELSGDQLEENTLSAKLTGLGGILIRATESIKLENLNNDYTGPTEVNQGKLVVGSSGSLGKTNILRLSGVKTMVDLYGQKQSVGSLFSEPETVFDFNGGRLTINDQLRTDSINDPSGGHIKGRLKGRGEFIVDPSEVLIEGANPDLRVVTQITEGSEIKLNNVLGLGVGSIKLVGVEDKLTLTRFANASAQGQLKNQLLGTGQVWVEKNAEVALAGDNHSFTGKFVVLSDGKLTASEAKHLGGANVETAGTLTFANDQRWQLKNTVSGSGEVIKRGMGELIIERLDHTGGTHILAGTLIVRAEKSGAYLGGANTPGVTIAKPGILSGQGRIEGSVMNQGVLASLNSLALHAGAASELIIGQDVHNAGLIRLAGSEVGNKLRVQGHYQGNNGQIVMNTVLGKDDSLTDQLIIEQGSSGTSDVIIQNQGGTGAQTEQGIKVIQVKGNSAGQFKLGKRVTAGAYEYKLYQGSTDAGDGDWYLRSHTPGYRAEIGAYLGNQSTAKLMFTHSRADRRETIGEHGLSSWSRIMSMWTSQEGSSGLKQKSRVAIVQLGQDVNKWVLPDAEIKIGVMGGLGYSQTQASTSIQTGHAYGRVSGYSVGLYATWYQAEQRGGYIDGVLQYGHYINRVSSEGLAAQRYRSMSVQPSIEGGYRVVLGESASYRWVMAPYGQLSYTRYLSAKVKEENAEITSMGRGSVLGKLGLRLKAEGGALNPFIELNWQHASQKERIEVASVQIRSDGARTRVGLKAGVDKTVNKHWQVWGQLGADKGKPHDHRYEISVGVKGLW
jgi:outer membrane autotransporter protein